MVSQDPTFTISVLVPVMLLIVVEIASIARSISLFEYLDSDAEEIERTKIGRRVEYAITLLPSFETGSSLPTFGHWGQLHSLNSTILIYGIAVVGYGLDGIAEFILSIAVLIVLVILPFLEIKELNAIRNAGFRPRAPSYRAIPVFILGSIPPILGEFFAEGGSLILVLLSGVVFVVIPLSIVEARFGVTLRNELERAKAAMKE